MQIRHALSTLYATLLLSVAAGATHAQKTVPPAPTQQSSTPQPAQAPKQQLAAPDSVPQKQPSSTALTSPIAGGKCILDFRATSSVDTLRMVSNKLPSGKYNAYLGGGVTGHCRDQDVTLISDSAEYYGDQDMLYLIGHVHYIETRAKIDAQRMNYWTDLGHLHAEQDVYAVMKSGATMRGPVAEYYRAVPGIRTQPLLNATGRPQLAMPQRDSVTNEVKDTVHMVADRINSINDSLVYAGGNVEITRTDFLATSDSAFLDNGTGYAQLMIRPFVKGLQNKRPFTLNGGEIDLFSKDKQVNRIVATPNGHAVSNDLVLDADSIDMRVRANTIQRAMAWGGKTRAHAVSPDHDILADSIDAILPDQRIQKMYAVRNAYATSIPDTATIATKERDWMVGDTIIATFDTTPSRDTLKDSNSTPPIKNIVAQVKAKAYYHLKNNNGVKDKPSINYVRGREIDIAFQDRQVQTVTVIDKASGVYVEQATDTTSARTQKPVIRSKQPSSRRPF